MDTRPMPNEHSARLKNPADFKEQPTWAKKGQKFARKADGTIYGKTKVPATVDVIWGQLPSQSGEEAAPQALRFPTKDWTAAEAKKWLKDNGVKYISFEEASGEKAMEDQLTTREMRAMPATYDKEKRSVRVVAATEKPTVIFDWERLEFVEEILLMDGMMLPEGRDQVPLLNSHMRFNIDSILGSGREFETVKDTKEANLYFSSTEEGVKAETKVREGHLTDLSIGYRVLESTYIPQNEKAIISGREFAGPVKVSTRSLLKEISLTPVGADEFAITKSMRMSASIRQLLVMKGLPEDATEREAIEFLQNMLNDKSHSTQFSQERKGTMPDEVKTPEQIAEENRKAADAARKAELERIQSIEVIAEKMEGYVPEIQKLRKEAITSGKTSQEFFDEVSKKMQPLKPAAPAEAAAADVKLRDFAKPWQRRAIKWLRAETFKANKKWDKAATAEKELQEMVRAIGPVQKDDELREAFDIITKSGIGEYQQFRLMSSLSAGAGAVLVPTPLLAEIFILVEKWGVCRRYCRPIPMMGAGDSLKLDSLTTEAIAYWVNQGANITAADLVFAQGSLTVGKIAGISSFTTEIEEDQAIALLPIFVSSLARAIYKKEDLAGFLGDGTATYGSMTGILAASTNVVTMSAGKTAFSDADADDYRALRDALNIDFRDGAMYMLSPSDVSNLEGLKDTQGRYIYREPAGGLPAMLWGFPIMDNVGVNALTQSSAVSTRFAAFGNPQHMLMGMKREPELVISREGVLQAGDGTISYNALQADGAIARLTERIGFKQVLTTAIPVLKTAAA